MKSKPHPLFTVYQWFISFPVLIVATILTAVFTIILSPLLPNSQISYYPARYWGRLFCGIHFIKVQMKNPEIIDLKKSYVIVSNHQSAFDIFAIYGWLPMIFKWMIKYEIKKIPLVGYACNAAGHIFIDRKNPVAAKKSIENAEKQLQNGVSLVIFPEGTRTKTGKMGKFKKGAFLIASDLELPILPVTLRGSFDRITRKTFRVKPGTIEMIFHEPIQVNKSTDIQKLMQQTHDIIHTGL